MIRAKNCEKLSKFVEVTAKILSVPFIRTRCIHSLSITFWAEMPRTEIIMTSFSSFYCWPTLDVMCRRRSARRPSVVRPCTLSTECDRRNLFITLIIVRCPSRKRNKARLRASFLSLWRYSYFSVVWCRMVS